MQSDVYQTKHLKQLISTLSIVNDVLPSAFELSTNTNWLNRSLNLSKPELSSHKVKDLLPQYSNCPILSESSQGGNLPNGKLIFVRGINSHWLMQMLRILIKALRIMEMGNANGNQKRERKAHGRATVLGSLVLHVPPLPVARFAICNVCHVQEKCCKTPLIKFN